MARDNGPIKVWNRSDTVPLDAEGGYAGGDSTAAAVGTSLAQSGQAVQTVDNLSATATVLPPGADPTVTVTGTLPHKVVNFGIPITSGAIEQDEDTGRLYWTGEAS